MVTWPPAAKLRGRLAPVLGSIHPQCTASKTERTWLEDPRENQKVIAKRALSENDFFLNIPDSKFFWGDASGWIVHYFDWGAQLLGDGHWGHCSAQGLLPWSAG